MKISERLKELLAKEEGELNINECFKLVHWTLKPEQDELGRSGEYLRL